MRILEKVLPPTFATHVYHPKNFRVLNRKIIISDIYPKLVLSISVADLRYIGFRASKKFRVTGNLLGSWVVYVILKPIFSLKGRVLKVKFISIIYPIPAF